MKKLIMFVSVFLLFSISALAQSNVQFAWDYGTMPTGFEMRLSNVAGGPVVRTFDCGPSAAKTCIVPNVAAGQWYARVLAYVLSTPSTLGSQYSDPSNEVAFIVAGKPVSPTNPRITGTGSASLTFDVPENQVAEVKLSFSPKQTE